MKYLLTLVLIVAAGLCLIVPDGLTVLAGLAVFLAATGLCARAVILRKHRWAASRRTMARAMGPWTGETTAVPTRPTWRSPTRSGSPLATGSDSRSPRRWRFGLPR